MRLADKKESLGGAGHRMGESSGGLERSKINWKKGTATGQ